MNVARRPRSWAMACTMYRKKIARSAVSSASANSKFDSNCPFASSWSLAYDPQPSSFTFFESVERNSYWRVRPFMS